MRQASPLEIAAGIAALLFFCGAVAYMALREPAANLRGMGPPPTAIANMQGQDLSGQRFENQPMMYVNLREANLSRAVLIGCALPAADLSHADLRGAQLLDCNLVSANLTGTDLRGATYDRRTQWPAGFDPEKHGARLVE